MTAAARVINNYEKHIEIEALSLANKAKLSLL